MDIEEAYVKMAKASGIQVGDTVKVLRRAQSYEMGWDNAWPVKMDMYVGKTGVVKKNKIHAGFAVQFPNDEASWDFPFFVLEVVLKEKPIYQFRPFDRVLVRDYDDSQWTIEFFECKLKSGAFMCLHSSWKECIPYEGNESLLNTTDMPE